jgi:hypothetical protein
MTDKIETRDELFLEAKEIFASGGFVCVKAPLLGGAFMVQKSDIERAMSEFYEMARKQRRQVIKSVKIKLENAAPKIKAGIATRNEIDNFATDTIILLAYEIMYGDAEKMLMPIPENIEGMP